MNKRFLGIFRALRHFGVNAKEIEAISNAYKWWIENPVETVPSYGTVYLKDGRFYSMPYPFGPITRFVGIEIAGVVYLTCYLRNVRFAQVEVMTQNLKDQMSLNDLGLDLRLPTRDEVKALMEIKPFGFGDLGDVWITPNSQHPERTFVAVNGNSVRACRPSEKTCANLYLVLRPDPQKFFKGEVDEYGKPTDETLKNYLLLR